MPRPSLGVVRSEVLLYAEDKATMIKHYDQGWTAMIRELVQNHCSMIRASGVVDTMNRLTAEDFGDD
jgi:hypothetical protein